jgi:methylenetetrahydrofolate dehydrogenase (NADP+)/methenyltetrahydrofolate cyclohydrolase
LGITVKHIQLHEDISEDELLKNIQQCNNDESINGIIVQLPIPKHLNKRKILDSIAPSKDVDGLGSVQSGLLYTDNEEAILPATARGVISLLQHYNISLEGRSVCVVGRSLVVGKPLATACLKKNATVTMCHSHTKNLENFTKNSDIIIVALGKPNYIDSKYVRDGQVIIDVGIHKIDNKICGDVDFDSVKDIVSAITPVPGGVGPLTVASLFENLVNAHIRNNVLK